MISHHLRRRPAGAHDDIFVARQPLFDRDRRVVGYELLYRSSRENIYTHDNGDIATLDTINNVMHVLGLGTVTEGKMAFVKITRNLLTNETYTLLPTANTVLEIVDASAGDEDFLKGCRKARHEGYRLVMDTDQLEVGPGALTNLADMVRIDFRKHAPAQRKSLAELYGAMRKTVIAAKVETHAEFEEALELDSAYVQGYFFCEPEVLSSRALTGTEGVYTRFFRAINEPEIDWDQTERIIKSDVSLCYQLLRYINSAAVGVKNKVESIHHALCLLGERALRRWGSLLTVRQLSRHKPSELVTTCLVRGYFCEQVGERIYRGRPVHDLFLLGLLSCMDAVMDRPMSDIVDHLSISDELHAALLSECDSPMRKLLDMVIACEQGDWGQVIALADELDRSQPEIAVLYYEAIRWADETLAG